MATTEMEYRVFVNVEKNLETGLYRARYRGHPLDKLIIRGSLEDCLVAAVREGLWK